LEKDHNAKKQKKKKQTVISQKRKPNAPSKKKRREKCANSDNLDCQAHEAEKETVDKKGMTILQLEERKKP